MEHLRHLVTVRARMSCAGVRFLRPRVPLQVVYLAILDSLLGNMLECSCLGALEGSMFVCAAWCYSVCVTVV